MPNKNESCSFCKRELHPSRDMIYRLPGGRKCCRKCWDDVVLKVDEPPAEETREGRL